MNQRERDAVRRVYEALGTVPGVTNPADIKNIVHFYRDMSEVRVYLRQVLLALLDRDPDYAEENRETVAELLRDLEEFLARRQTERWNTATVEYRFFHIG
jgi:hypothetical protein